MDIKFMNLRTSLLIAVVAAISGGLITDFADALLQHLIHKTEQVDASIVVSNYVPIGPSQIKDLELSETIIQTVSAYRKRLFSNPTFILNVLH
jgi:tryptophanyl-tRNA synthetase